MLHSKRKKAIQEYKNHCGNCFYTNFLFPELADQLHQIQEYFMIQPAVFTAKSTRLHCNQSIVKNSTRIYKHAVRSVGGPYIGGYDTR